MIAGIVKTFQDNTVRRGVDWSPIHVTTVPYVPSATAYDDERGVLVAVNASGIRIHRSLDQGKTWTQATILPALVSANTVFSDVCYGHGMWLALGRETVGGNGFTFVLQSTDDGATWDEVARWSVSVGGSMTRMCKTTTGFAGIGGYLWETTDGVTWPRASSAYAGSEIASNGTGLIVVYATGLRVRDQFGNWTDVPLTLSGSRFIGVWDNKYFVSVWNAAKTWAVSADNGQNWNVQTHALPSNANNRGATGGGVICTSTTTANKVISSDGVGRYEEKTITLSGGRVGYAANRFFVMTANQIIFSY